MNKILEFQTANGLEPDGKLGPITLNTLKNKLKLLSNAHAAHFLGQASHESGGFSADTENLNYSAEGLRKTFPKYFLANATALKYARKPEMIANKVYANRMGNGDEASGDGYKYRGRGAIQLTGKSNYTAFAKYMCNNSILTNPDIVATKYYFESAIFFFANNKLFDLCNKVDDTSIINVTKRVNGGVNGLKQRAEETKRFYNLLNSINSGS